MQLESIDMATLLTSIQGADISLSFVLVAVIVMVFREALSSAVDGVAERIGNNWWVLAILSVGVAWYLHNQRGIFALLA